MEDKIKVAVKLAMREAVLYANAPTESKQHEETLNKVTDKLVALSNEAQAKTLKRFVGEWGTFQLPDGDRAIRVAHIEYAIAQLETPSEKNNVSLSNI